MADALETLDATAQAELVASGEVTPAELVDAAIERAERINPEINAIIHPLYDDARNAAAGRLPDVHALLAIGRGEHRRVLRPPELCRGVEQHAGERAAVVREAGVDAERPVRELVEHDTLGAVAPRQRCLGEVDPAPLRIARPSTRCPGSIAGRKRIHSTSS